MALVSEVSAFVRAVVSAEIASALLFTWVSKAERLTDTEAVALIYFPSVDKVPILLVTVALALSVITFFPASVRLLKSTLAAVSVAVVLLVFVVVSLALLPDVSTACTAACTATPTGIARLMDKTAITMPRARLPCLLKTFFSISWVSDLVRPLASSDTT